MSWWENITNLLPKMFTVSKDEPQDRLFYILKFSAYCVSVAATYYAFVRALPFIFNFF